MVNGLTQRLGLKKVNKTNVVAVIAAHPDDEVLGCGGAIARFVAEGKAVHVLIMSDGVTSRWGVEKSDGQSELAARNRAAHEANEILGTTSLQVCDLPDNRMDSIDRLDVIKRIEEFISRVHPDLVLTHHCGDVNIDHRVVHDAVVAACRAQPGFCVRELLFFEVPSSTEWRPAHSALPFGPNVFIDITFTLDKKMEALRAYAEELRAFPHPRSVAAVESLARWRGATAGVDAAEAFLLGRRIS